MSQKLVQTNDQTTSFLLVLSNLTGEQRYCSRCTNCVVYGSVRFAIAQRKGKEAEAVSRKKCSRRFDLQADMYCALI